VLPTNLNTVCHHELGPTSFDFNQLRRSLGSISTAMGPGIILAMDTAKIIQSIDAEIARLEQARELLNGHRTTPKRGRSASSTTATVRTLRKRRMISAEGRARIAAAQKARWAKAKGK
jgi:hypothetical protein